MAESTKFWCQVRNGRQNGSECPWKEGLYANNSHSQHQKSVHLQGVGGEHNGTNPGRPLSAPCGWSFGAANKLIILVRTAPLLDPGLLVKTLDLQGPSSLRSRFFFDDNTCVDRVLLVCMTMSVPACAWDKLYSVQNRHRQRLDKSGAGCDPPTWPPGAGARFGDVVQ